MAALCAFCPRALMARAGWLAAAGFPEPLPGGSEWVEMET